MELGDILLVALVVAVLIYILGSDSGGGRRGRLPASL
jgi:hypothetical protein